MKILGCIKSGYGCLVKFLALIGLLVVLGALLLLGMGSALIRLAGADGIDCGANEPECERMLQRRWVCGDGDADDPEVICISLRGVISSTREAGMFAELESEYSRALRHIRAATRDADVRGIVLRLDTPGGTVTDSDIMADALRRFKAAGENRFVLVFMGSMCCSGGYYVAAEADYILANPTTLTGSIGVIMNGLNAAELAKKIGVRSVVVASGSNKALLDPLEPVNPEHVAILRRPVEQDYERFVSLVARGRKLPVDEVKKIADGRVLSAQDALDAKLIDGLGYLDDAWQKAAELAGSEHVRIYRYEEPFSWRSLLSEATFMKYGKAFVAGAISGLDDAAPQNEYRLR